MKLFLCIFLSAAVFLQTLAAPSGDDVEDDCPEPTRGALNPETCRDCQCAIRPKLRKKCVVQKKEGESLFDACLSAGCCYDERPNVPYCYQPRLTFPGQTKANCSVEVKPENRTRKGWWGISRQDCYCMGGCFNDCEPDTIWCYSVDCSKLNIAIVIVVDGSGSIDSDEYEDQRKFMRKLASSFTIGPNRTQIGIIEFESTIDEVLEIEDVNSLSDVIDFIDDTMQPCPTKFCKTNTAAAIERMIEMVETIEDKEKVVVVLTDGISNVGNLTQALMGVPDDVLMYSVGIDGAVESELLEIAKSGKDADAASDRVYSVDNFSELSTVIDNLREEVCVEDTE